MVEPFVLSLCRNIKSFFYEQLPWRSYVTMLNLIKNNYRNGLIVKKYIISAAFHILLVRLNRLSYHIFTVALSKLRHFLIKAVKSSLNLISNALCDMLIIEFIFEKHCPSI